MTQSDCIMKIGDYISIKTVHELTCEQYQKFREYLRSYGYSIKEEFGAYIDIKKSSLYWHKFVRLNRLGDLVWSGDTGTDSGREIALNKILKVIMNKPTVETHDFRNMNINEIDASIAHQATIEEMKCALAKHDWYYEFSDDYCVYQRGRNNADLIYKLRMRAVSEGFGDIAEELFNAAIPKR